MRPHGAVGRRAAPRSFFPRNQKPTPRHLHGFRSL